MSSSSENKHPNHHHGGVKQRQCNKRKGCCVNTIYDFKINHNDDELIEWINHEIDCNFDTLKDALGGAAACQIIDKLFYYTCDDDNNNNDISIFTNAQWKQIDWLPTQSFICANNYKILMNVLHEKLNIEKYTDIIPLATQRMMASRTFYCWLKSFYILRMKNGNNHQKNGTYSLRKRVQSKNGKDFQNLVDNAKNNNNNDELFLFGHQQHEEEYRKRKKRKQQQYSKSPSSNNNQRNKKQTIKLSHLLKIDHTTLSKFDRKVKVKWPSNMKLQQRKKRMKEKANGGKNNKTTKDIVFNMFYGDNL